jgi:DNA-binding transcriptional ArsR family regulator
MNDNHFHALRKIARERRDKDIAAIQAHYEAVLVQLSAIEQDLFGRVPINRRSIASCIESVIPSDRTFTTHDVMTELIALDPGRTWRKRSLESHLTRLRERGLIKRLRKGTGKTLSLYARADCGDEQESKPIKVAVAEVLTQPMRLAEIVVAVLETGHRTTQTRNEFRNTVRRVLREGGYRQDGERWAKE